MFYSGPTADGVYITKATYSLVAPKTPTGAATSGGNEELAFWIGIQNSPNGGDVLNENFVQPLLNWAPSQKDTGCDATEKQWCITTSTYTPQGQLPAGYKPLDPGASVDFEIVVDGSVTQTVYVDGEVYQQQTDSEGMKPGVFYGSNECYLQNCGSLDAYSYTDIVVELSEADPNFGDTLSLTGATSDGFTTSDGGKTWKNAKITINKDTLA
ncbi:uncharacterized protein K452DRAFT_259010 [Aplosporella prunicola CBS 121167]|uniref:Polysaccharide lyase family 14 protein n=1 Tax=Aplosporella prunicola CBS 121167 TaxID=1176127 RepID=A0A6A6B198_9PEZI|nr:uncharacterized protein K452DRAFT_259010 [Aplosporella prunicola CBS 121167]KAF2136511.1 hypothetical protein K452DRAFT_259010 [Aplosporella prunicola CBS 121167]